MKIIILGGAGESTKYVYNYLSKQFDIERVIIEQPVSSKKLLKGRVKKLGYFKVINQLFFQVITSKILRLISKKKIRSLKKLLDLDSSPIPKEKCFLLASINNNVALNLISQLAPEIIIVNGTRIISDRILKSCNATFINTHVGITPQYRGVHGGYWALVNNDKENCGVTIHTVDSGVDTGGVLKQGLIKVEPYDNFHTYPLKQYATGLPLLAEVISTKINKEAFNYMDRSYCNSNLYYHPSFSEYLFYRFYSGVK
ncbi:formyl transferase [Dokdonia sp. Hel_I_53]|uniref:formyl transferase n=1 Tax=Dokdonia sp. Hel_I_53 TaxID=1566287 RepID=UPI00119C855D|nr:formyl transferase [Dokdonia sp. Hel_I_53]TVZ51349.1 formyl transferase-like protein [Dokdonia sp. Hel_I_53]